MEKELPADDFVKPGYGMDSARWVEGRKSGHLYGFSLDGSPKMVAEPILIDSLE